MKILTLIKEKIRHITGDRPVLLQQRLLELALMEIGISPREVQITIDHINGTSTVNGVELGLIYPKAFFTYAGKLSGIKIHNYYFNGMMTLEGNRTAMLEPYTKDERNLIVNSSDGRINRRKGQFNYEYYRRLRASNFALCPHQADWPGSRETIWTYRFVEACISASIPIVFRTTPLGNSFVEGFHYFWDDAPDHAYSETLANQNKTLALERFTISSRNHLSIIQSISNSCG